MQLFRVNRVIEGKATPDEVQSVLRELRELLRQVIAQGRW